MIPVTTFAGATVAVFGLARSGLAAAHALLAGGAKVACWDDGERSRGQAQAEGLPLVNLTTADWSAFTALVVAPGVPLTHPEPHWTVKRARSAGLPVIGDTELFFRELAQQARKPHVIGITGTNGKSTTTALCGHLLRMAGLGSAMGGNIGEAVLGLPPFGDIEAYVIELSSYQIDLTPTLGPAVGVMSNLTPDHLDRHGTLEHYAAVKERLVAGAETAVVGLDDGWSRAMALHRCARGLPTIGVHVTEDATRPAGAVTAGDLAAFEDAGGTLWLASPEGEITARRDRRSEVLASLATVATLRGAHNAQNAGLALAACHVLGIPIATLASGLDSYPGLAHRCELIGRIGRVLFVNDSKATNADAAAKALSAYDGIFWIAGGLAKEGGIESLAPFFPRMRKAYLIGKAAQSFSRTLASAGVAHVAAGTLEAAVMAAATDAAAAAGTESVVLLSPACASFDQFTDFEHRGNAFRTLVSQLPGLVRAGATAP